ncbi:MAG: DEAD/DEAH box helicase [Myxococcota bacterium]
MKFADLNLPEPLLTAVEELGWETPTPIQAQALPHLLDDEDLAGQAQTGTGKTACFLLAAMKKLLEGERPDDGTPRTLIVAPTRELAMQIAGDAKELAVHTDLEIALAYGGTNWEKQANDLRTGADIVVGTPGRLIDYHKRRVLDLRNIEVFVLDEADRMFDMGFIKDISYLYRSVPSKSERQSLLFSATLREDVMRLAYRFMDHPVNVSVTPEELVVDKIDQVLYHVASDEKLELLLGLLQKEQPDKSLVFVNTKRWGEELTWRLNQNGYQAVYMSGDIPQRKRQKFIEAFKEGKIDLLVATDVASRGIHVDDVTHVFNYDIPQDPEDYVHRIGRTARAGARGNAITLACENWVMNLPAIESYVGDKIPSDVPGEELIGTDHAGRFRRHKKPYTGWPGDERKSKDAGSGSNKRAGSKPKKRAESKPRNDDERKADARRPADKRRPAKASGEKKESGGRRRRRRRIGDGPALSPPSDA